MAVSERFGQFQGTVLGVQVRPITGPITVITVDGVKVRSTQTEPRREATVNVTIDGDLYEFQLSFSDETLDRRDFLGHEKRRIAN